MSIHAAGPASSAFFNRYAFKIAECTVSSSSSPAFPKSCTKGPSWKPLVPAFATLFSVSVLSDPVSAGLPSLVLSIFEVDDIPKGLLLAKGLLVAPEPPKPKPTGFPMLPFDPKPPKGDDDFVDGSADDEAPNVTLALGRPKGFDFVSLLSLDEVAVEVVPKLKIERGVGVVAGSAFALGFGAGVGLLLAGLSILNENAAVVPCLGGDESEVDAGSGTEVVGNEGNLNGEGDSEGADVAKDGVQPPPPPFPKVECALDDEGTRGAK